MAVKNFKVKAPRGGWNSRDPVSDMDPNDAVSMTNLISDVDGVSVRPGFSLYGTLVGATVGWVNSLISWKTQYGERFIAAAPASVSEHRLFDITTATFSTIKTGYTGSKWKHGVMSGRMALVNGTDLPQELNYTPGTGVTITDLTVSGPSILEALSVVHIHKARSYFATGSEPSFWYSAVNALGGTLTRFPIDRVAESSGNVIDIKSWTRDGGLGTDDFFVIFLDTGEILVYQGSNPNDADDWALVGRYKLGKVLATTQFGGKIHCVTDQDYNILPDDLLTEGIQLFSKMSGAARDAVRRDSSDNYQILFEPQYGWRIVNVPYGSLREQHIMSLRTGAPTRFDIEANVWCRFRGELYFGGKNTKVYKIRPGDDNGAAITWSVQQAFTDFGVSHPKGVRVYRPVWTTSGDLTIGSGLKYDYSYVDFMQTSTGGVDGPPWDTSPWNTTSWTVGTPVLQEWLTASGRGTTVSLVQSGTATEKSTWHQTDYRVEIGDDLL